jgi:hypothetical protein
MEGHAKSMPVRDFFEAQARGDRNREGIHRQSEGDAQERNRFQQDSPYPNFWRKG